jgi:hypothetical protein
MTADTLAQEAEKMRRVPGIIFVDGATGRRPHADGTGLDVFEIIKIYREVDEDWERLRSSLYWLPEAPLRAALLYTQLYPDEIEERLRREDYWTPETLYAAYPFMNPDR